MKKRLIIGLACLTAGIGLAGCGASNTQSTETTTAETTTTTVETTLTTTEATTTTETTTMTEATTTTTTEAPTTTTTEVPTTIANAHSEDGVFMEYLRSIINTQTGDLVSRFAIADFDADGSNELMFELPKEYRDGPMLYMHESDDVENFSLGIKHEKFSDITFLDNGVAYAADDKSDHFDSYYLLNKNLLPELNYNLSLADYAPNTLFLYYYKNDSAIEKVLEGEIYSSVGILFDPVEKTQEQYDKEKQILNNGNVLDVQVIDFTADNIGL